LQLNACRFVAQNNNSYILRHDVYFTVCFVALFCGAISKYHFLAIFF
jgi:hypothetical protein